VAVLVVGGDRDRLCAACGLRAGAGDGKLRGDVRVDGDGQAVGAGGGDRGGTAAAVGGAGDDVGGLDLVELHRAAGGVGDAVGEGERFAGAEVDGCPGLVGDCGLGDGVAGGVGAGEGDRVVAGVAGGDVAVL